MTHLLFWSSFLEVSLVVARRQLGSGSTGSLLDWSSRHMYRQPATDYQDKGAATVIGEMARLFLMRDHRGFS